MAKMNDPDGTRLPIKLDSTSNGEFSPIPLDGANRRANELAQRAASENARRLGIGRRAFMVSAMGAASTLLAFNAANAAAGRTGGSFILDSSAALDADAAAAVLRKSLSAWLSREEASAQVAGWIGGLLDAYGDLDLRRVLEDLDLLESFTEHSTELAQQAALRLFETDAFGDWLEGVAKGRDSS